MKSKLLLLSSIFTSFLFFNPASAQVSTSDSLALVDLYNNTNGPAWYNHNNWLTTQPLNSWQGVQVIKNRVSGLDLSYNNLSGTLPASIGNLDSMSSLQLAHNNNLTGNIPESIGHLKELEVFILSYNHFTGNIPASIGKLYKVSDLRLDNNELSGDIPSSIGNIKPTGSILGLIFLYLDHNGLTGSIPNSLGNLTNLQGLQVNNNNLSGNLPSSLTNLINLTDLDASYNMLSGSIPNNIGRLSHLSFLYLQYNQFTGELPNSVFKLPSYPNNNFNLSHNHLSDKRNYYAPNDNSSLHLDVSYNSFTFNGLEYIATGTKNPVYTRQDTLLPVHRHQEELAVTAGGMLCNNSYTWFRNGDSITTITGDSTFTPTESGTYYAKIMNSLAPKLILKTKRISYTASVQPQFVASVSPNPARNLLQVSGLTDRTDVEITVADMNGYVWLRTMSRKQTMLTLDISPLKTGNYLINLSEGKQIKTIQFMKE